MKLTEEELKQAEKNRKFMRHMTASFWGFILVSIASILLWGKINQWMGESSNTVLNTASIELFIHPEDSLFWQHNETEKLLEAYSSKGVKTIWLPYSIQGSPFFSTKSLKYGLDTELKPVEYQWFKKAVFLKWTEAIEDSDIALSMYYWADDITRSFNSVASIRPNWFYPNSFLPNLNNDSTLQLYQALIDEARIKWETEEFGLVSSRNQEGISHIKQLTDSLLTKRGDLPPLRIFEQAFVSSELQSISILRWLEMSPESQNEVKNSTNRFLVYSSPTFSAVRF